MHFFAEQLLKKQCQGNLNKLSALAKEVLFTDKKVFRWDHKGGGSRWSVPGGESDPGALHDFTVACYGGITWWGGTVLIMELTGTDGVQLRFGEDNSCNAGGNAKEYVEHILPKLLPSARKLYRVNNVPFGIFMHDADPAHTTNEEKYDGLQTKNYIEAYTGKKSDRTWFNWPAGSHDFNLVDDVWLEMERRMQDASPRPSPQSLEEFKVLIQKTWKEVTGDQDFRERLFGSFAERVQYCIKAKGGRFWVSY